MPTIKRYTTETITDGESKRVERVAYVAKDGKEFGTPQAAYRHDIQTKLVRALGPAIDPKKWGCKSTHFNPEDWVHDRAMEQGFERAVNQMLDRPEEVIRLLELWRTNKDL